VKLEWLEKTVALMQVGTDIEEMRNILLDYVGKTRSVGQAKTRGSGEITVTILLSDHKRGGGYNQAVYLKVEVIGQLYLGVVIICRRLCG